MCFLSTSSHELCYLNTLFVSSIPGISHTDSKEDINKTQKTTRNLPKPQVIPGQCSGDTSFPQKNTAAPTEAAPEQSDLGLLGLMHQADWVLLLLQKRKKNKKTPKAATSRYAASGYMVLGTKQPRALTQS